MIQINLLPEELKAKAPKASAKMDTDKLLYLFPVTLAAVVFVHCVLAVVQFVGFARLNAFNTRMKALEPQRKELESRRLAASDPGKLAIDSFAAESIPWSMKLNSLSGHVPAGVWFTDLAVSPKSMVVRGTVVSLEEDEMAAINNFMSKLRGDPAFMKWFGALELGPLGSRMLGSYSVTDFILTIPVVGAGPAAGDSRRQ